MSDWHGYPQQLNAYPGRPWWQPVSGLRWHRTDGATADGFFLAAYDAKHPLPVPPPLCGQVWAWEHGSEMVHRVSLHESDGFHVYMGYAEVMDGEALPSFTDEDWPPEGAVLVAGPGAPWGPM